MTTKKPSAAQRLALSIAAGSADGTIVCAGGGYWVSSDVAPDERRALREGLLRPVPENVGTTTVYACEAAGWFERCNIPFAASFCDSRRVTEAGRAALAMSAKGP